MYEMFQMNETHWLHDDPRSVHFVQKSTPEDPNFGHLLERFWTMLFRCTTPDLVDRCNRRECACFD